MISRMIFSSQLSAVSYQSFPASELGSLIAECSRRTAYFNTSVTEPAPTVCPPSRIANRKPFSMAMGVISSISGATLSPGITISVPAGNCATPVTSVVRK